MDRILITGGAGFIGSNIAEALINRGAKVVVLDDLSTGKRENIAHLEQNGGLIFVEGSLLERNLLRSIIKAYDIGLISHQAARPSVQKSIMDPVGTTAINITGTVTLLNVAVECGCKRVVFASSSSVYGNTPTLPKMESMPLNPASPYAASKATKEMYARIFSSIYGLDVVGLRYFNVYGRRQNPNSDYAAVIPKFISKAINNEAISIDGDGAQTRDFTYIKDVVAANIKALTSEHAANRVFNVAYGDRISVLGLARLVIEFTGSRSEIRFGPTRIGDVRDSLADIQLARTHLGYAPEYDIRRGLSETVEWYRGTMAH